MNSLVLILSLLTGAALAEHSALPPSADDKKSIYDLIAARELPEVLLVADFDLLEDNRNTMDYQMATFTFEDEVGHKKTWNIEVRNRGRYRRRKCDFPPIKLKFEKDSLESNGLEKHNELKLVTHCLDDREGKENLLREYLIYKLYEIISPIHYRAQLVNITYLNSSDGKDITRYGVILEDENELADRLNCDLCEDCYATPKSDFVDENLQVFSLFQYMIGNPDWSIRQVRNIKLLKQEEGEKFYIAPYDFDFTGLVDAGYAVPDPTLGITSVRQRVFLGPAESPEELAHGMALFREKRQELIEYVENYDYLKKSSRKDVLKYIESFYEELDSGNIFETGAED